jgi:hypothetical protein
LVKDYQQKLAAWARLRDRHESTEQCLRDINAWWFRYPWTAYLLHWDDREQWPDPWQLLEEPRLCDLARGLGILYTVAMLDCVELADSVLTEGQDNNLVLVSKGKYILNWCPDQIVNINPCVTKNPQHQFTLVQAQQRIR